MISEKRVVNAERVLKLLKAHLKKRDELVKKVGEGATFDALAPEIDRHTQEAGEISSLLYQHAANLEAKAGRLLGAWEEGGQKTGAGSKLGNLIKDAKLLNGLADQFLEHHGSDMESIRLAHEIGPAEFAKRAAEIGRMRRAVNTKLERRLM